MSYSSIPVAGFAIDKDIPIPGRRNLVKSPLRIALEAMQVGDSIFLDTHEQHEFVRGSRKALHPMVFTTRKVEGGWRAWRTA